MAANSLRGSSPACTPRQRHPLLYLRAYHGNSGRVLWSIAFWGIFAHRGIGYIGTSAATRAPSFLVGDRGVSAQLPETSASSNCDTVTLLLCLRPLASQPMDVRSLEASAAQARREPAHRYRPELTLLSLCHSLAECRALGVMTHDPQTFSSVRSCHSAVRGNGTGALCPCFFPWSTAACDCKCCLPEQGIGSSSSVGR